MAQVSGGVQQISTSQASDKTKRQTLPARKQNEF